MRRCEGRRWRAAALAAVLAACGAPSAAVKPSGAGLAACRNGDVPYEISYPATWHANLRDAEPTCRLFDPDPLGYDGTGEPGAAIAVRVEPLELDSYLRELSGPAQDLLERRRLEIAGRRSLRLRLRATRDSRMLPPGTRVTEYVIDIGGRVLVLRASARPGSSLESVEQVLDRMVFTLQLR